MSTDHIAGIFIPARLESTRLPRKMLLDVGGKPLIVRTCERVATLGMPYAVATDSEEIADAVRDSGHECILTCEANNGTERISIVASSRRLSYYSGMDCWYVIVQGDEPEIDVDILRNFVDRLRNIQDGAATISTTADPGDTHRRSVVKVVTDIDGRALWFSRDLPIGNRHVGVYAYRERVLLDYLACEPCQAEVEFSLEQMRTLHLGHAMRVVHYPGMRCRGVDTVEDYESLVSVGLWRTSKGMEARVLAQFSNGSWVGEVANSSSSVGFSVDAWLGDGSGWWHPGDSFVERLGDLPPPDVITGPGVYVTRGGTEINIICPSVVNRGWWIGEDCNGEVDHWLPCGNRSVTEAGAHSLVRRLRDLPETAK